MLSQLLALQDRQLGPKAAGAPKNEGLEALRGKAPEVLAHYERLILRGKKGVAVVRNGVCGACHLRITRGNLVALARPNEVQQCDNCGCHLLPVDEPKPVVEEKPVRASRVGRPRRAASPHAG